VIFEYIALIKIAIKAIKKVKEELGEMPEDATRIIQFLNSKKKYELQELDIEDRKETIRKVLSKRNLMLNLEDKCQNMQVVVDIFMAKFQILGGKGLPSPLVVKDKIMTR